jgi:hypothetical protein
MTLRPSTAVTALCRRARLAPLLLPAMLLLWSAACDDPADELPVNPTAVATSEAQPRTYVVRRGDTLARIATREGVPLAELVALNAIDDPDVIEVGAELLLEPAAAVPPNPERSIVSRDPSGPGIVERLRDLWEGLYRPDVRVAPDALSQGVAAALMLPAAVLAFVALWLIWRLVRRAPLSLAHAGASAARAARPPRLTLPRGRLALSFGRLAFSPAAALEAPARLARRAAIRSSRPRRPAPVPPPAAAARPPRSYPTLPIKQASQRSSHIVARAAAGLRSAVQATIRTLATLLRSGRARGDRNREQRALSHDRRRSEELWLRGTELLRIGLRDDAHRAFDEGVRLARRHDWPDLVQRHLDGLDEIVASARERHVR